MRCGGPRTTPRTRGASDADGAHRRIGALGRSPREGVRDSRADGADPPAMETGGRGGSALRPEERAVEPADGAGACAGARSRERARVPRPLAETDRPPAGRPRALPGLGIDVLPDPEGGGSAEAPRAHAAACKVYAARARGE